MEIEDILSNIMSKVDEKTLHSLIGSQFLVPLSNLMKRQTFWHQRSEYLVGHSIEFRSDVDWRDAHAVIREGLSDERYWYEPAIGSLPLLLTVSEALDRPIPTSGVGLSEIVKWTPSLDVIRYLFEERRAAYTNLDLWSFIIGQIRRGHEEIAAYLIALIPPDQRKVYEATLAMEDAIGRGMISIFEKLRPHAPDVRVSQLLESAAASGKLDVLQYVLREFEGQYTEESLRDVLPELLDIAILHRSSGRVVRYLLDLVSPDADLLPYLYLSLNLSNRTSFSALLADPRSHVAENLDAIVSRVIASDEMEQLLSWNDDFSLVLREIVSSHPSRIELMDWMIAARRPAAIIAARAILTGVREHGQDVAPMRALLLSMVYPDMEVSEIESLMIDAGYDGEDLFRSSILMRLARAGADQRREQELTRGESRS